MGYRDAIRAARGDVLVAESRFTKRGGKDSDLSTVLSGNQNPFAMLLVGSPNDKRSQLYKEFKHWVYVAVSYIAKRFAGQPVTIGKLKNAPTIGTLAAMFDWRVKAAPDMDVVTDSDLNSLMQRPNAVQGKFEYLYCCAANLLLTGESYIVYGEAKDRDGMETYAVPSNWMTPIHKKGLFAQCSFKAPGEIGEGLILEANQFKRTYIPDPSNVKGCISPVETQLRAIRTDDKIQESQEQMFKSIFPNVLLTLGKNIGHDGKPLETRPVLTGAQRAQLVRVVRQVWMQTGGNGDPGILDGLIESCTKLSNTPKEMDWLTSGKSVKERIFQAFHLNPIAVGEVPAASRAQALEAERSVCVNVLNPLCDQFSVSLSDSLGLAVDDSGKTVVRIEPAMPLDEALQLQQWKIGLDTGAAGPDEYRANILHLPPREKDDEESPKPALAGTVGGITGAVAIVSAAGMGQITPEAAQGMFEYFFEMSPEMAGRLAQVPEHLPALGLPPVVDGGKPQAQPDNLAASILGMSKQLLAMIWLKSKGVVDGVPDVPRISRAFVKGAHEKQALRLEKEVAAASALYFPGAANGDRQ